MNKSIKTISVIENIIRKIIKMNLKVQLIINFDGGGGYIFNIKLSQEATKKVFSSCHNTIDS